MNGKQIESGVITKRRSTKVYRYPNKKTVATMIDTILYQSFIQKFGEGTMTRFLRNAITIAVIEDGLDFFNDIFFDNRIINKRNRSEKKDSEMEIE